MTFRFWCYEELLLKYASSTDPQLADVIVGTMLNMTEIYVLLGRPMQAARYAHESLERMRDDDSMRSIMLFHAWYARDTQTSMMDVVAKMNCLSLPGDGWNWHDWKDYLKSIQCGRARLAERFIACFERRISLQDLEKASAEYSEAPANFAERKLPH